MGSVFDMPEKEHDILIPPFSPASPYCQRNLPWILFTEIKTNVHKHISQITLYISRNKCDTKRNVYKVTDTSSFSIPTSPQS
jgi:hypothetical protein